MKKEIITIAGHLGSGKSSTGKLVAEALGYRRASTGDFMRQMASDRGITLEDLTKLAEKDENIDRELDDHNKNIGNESGVVLDSRLGFFFIPESFKVFIALDPEVAAKRILKDKENNPNRLLEAKNFDSVEQVADSIRARLSSERGRYKTMYGIEDQTAKENFDLVINSGDTEYDNNQQGVVAKIVEEYEKWMGK